MEISMYIFTAFSDITNMTIRGKPRKLPVTVPTCIALRRDTYIPFILLVFIAGQNYSKDYHLNPSWPSMVAIILHFS